ncbi:GNAT family N-acetyltransferase [Natronolimnohabitans innermongolicus]|uniref:Acetyltransferase n=1 Tax=Natronolimnohabitans innermongolicus JCM 12255 TaxID=1227499 RepID=L9XK15_9EURY|nr:GNAT family N-acetyltransferase [Natronolimnohabitans innermongolicus]ELY62055.1 acetyltransferase [Natronolimnohabitans innermongolicus JCM 12255]
MVDYRPIPDERDVFHEYRSYAFRPEGGVPTYDPDEHEAPRDTMGSRRGIFADGADATAADVESAKPRSVCRHYWLESRVRGDAHRTAGLASVATPPEFRRRGHVRQLLAHSLAEYRDRNVRFSILWPFRYRFYRQYGWDTANRIVTHECEPATLSFTANAVAEDDGRFRRLEADEYDRLEAAYDAHRRRYALSLERDAGWWRHRIFGGHDRDPFVYGYERDGEIEGYLVYAIDGENGDGGGADDRTMAVSELVARDHETLLALLAFCHRHESQVGRVRLRVPESVPLREIARDPDEIETTVSDGPMVRLVDVAEALSALSSPTPTDRDAHSPLTVAVDDPLADWNDGTFRLAPPGEGEPCAPADGTDPADADVRLGIAALSQLVVGVHGAAHLERVGRLEASESTAVETLEVLFPETDVYFGHYF